MKKQSKYLDPLQRRAELAAYIASKAEGGICYFYEWGRDCDQVEASGITKIHASVLEYEKLENRMYDNAEGAVACDVISPTEAEGFKPYFKDHRAEQYNF